MNSKTFKACTTSFPLHIHNTLSKGELKNLSYNFMTLWLHTLKQSHIHLSLPKANNALTVGMLHIALGIHNFEYLRELWLNVFFSSLFFFFLLIREWQHWALSCSYLELDNAAHPPIRSHWKVFLWVKLAKGKDSCNFYNIP